MIKLGLIVSVILLLVGCSSKEENTLMKEYQKNRTYFRTLQKTEKILLTKNNITKVALSAKYMRDAKTLLGDENNETFIIGLYLEDEDIVNIQDIYGLKKEGNKTEVLEKIYEDNKTKQKFMYDHNITQESKYRLTLNGVKALSIKRIDINDERLKGIPLKSDWTAYAEVRFGHSKKRLMKLKFESSLYGIGEASFSKVAKYVDSKKVF